MNCSKTNELLNSIDETLTTSNVGIGSVSTYNNLMNTKLSNINTILNTISNDTALIKSDVDTLTKTKIYFNGKLTDGVGDNLTRANYTSSPIDFYWSNDKPNTAYICKYRFIYPDGTEPTSSQLYHSTAWECKIGAMNSAGTDYEAPYITINDNRDNLYQEHTNSGKQQWVSDQCFVYENDFRDAPIEIGVSRKFGHYIASDFSNTSLYERAPIGIVDGYYYES